MKTGFFRKEEDVFTHQDLIDHDIIVLFGGYGRDGVRLIFRIKGREEFNFKVNESSYAFYSIRQFKDHVETVLELIESGTVKDKLVEWYNEANGKQDHFQKANSWYGGAAPYGQTALATLNCSDEFGEFDIDATSYYLI